MDSSRMCFLEVELTNFHAGRRLVGARPAAYRSAMPARPSIRDAIRQHWFWILRIACMFAYGAYVELFGAPGVTSR